MFDSLKFRLTLALVSAATLVGILAAGTAFYDTYRQTHKLQDDLLKQIAAYITPAASVPVPQGSRNDAGISVYIADGIRPPVRFPAGLSEGFYTFEKDDGIFDLLHHADETRFFYDLKNAGELYSAYLRPVPQGMVAVLQENEYREELAVCSAWASVLPVLALSLLTAVFSYLVVHRSMQPLTRLAAAVSRRREDDLTALQTAHLPSEVQPLTEAVNRQLAQTDRFVQQQKRFIADAVHELRSPMTALSLQAERLAGFPLPEGARTQLETLRQGIRRSRDLLEQLLSLARLQNTAAAPKQSVDVHAVFRRVIEDLLPLAEVKAQDIGVVSDGEVRILADETDIYLLVKTLAENAVRHTPSGSRIDLGACEQAGTLTLFVEDNGEGIPAAERNRVFDPFYRRLGASEHGSGLGLAIAQNIVRNYGGSMMLSDSPNFTSGLRVSAVFPQI